MQGLAAQQDGVPAPYLCGLHGSSRRAYQARSVEGFHRERGHSRADRKPESTEGRPWGQPLKKLAARPRII